MNTLIRVARTSESSLVLASWKADLAAARPEWGKGLQAPEWWALVNYTVDRLAYPRCATWVVCHVEEPDIPLAWMTMADNKVLHQHASDSVQRDPELGAYLERLMLDTLQATHGPPFNPFEELKRHGGYKT